MAAGVVTAWAAEIGIITYRDMTGKSLKMVQGKPVVVQNKGQSTAAGLPLPADYLAAFLIFGALGMVPSGHPASKVATAIAWGLVVASFMGLYDPTLLPGLQVGKKPNPSTPTLA